MMNKRRPGPASLERISFYRRLAGVAPVRESYARKFALVAFVGSFVPLAVFIVYLLATRTNWTAIYPPLVALILASFAGFLWLLWAMRELLAPVDVTAEALRDYIDRRRLPELPVDLPDTAGRLMEGTQYSLEQLDATIQRLERVSDTDDLTGMYNRRAGEKRLTEEVARAERDLQSFQIALIDIKGLASINECFGHAAGDACIAHMGEMLQLNTRRGDWIARWGGDDFIVGLHRNRSVKNVVARIVRAVESHPCEVAPGNELALQLACGVADYRFGSGAAGLLADVEHALYAAREQARHDGGSHICFRSELDAAPRAAPQPLAAPLTG